MRAFTSFSSLVYVTSLSCRFWIIDRYTIDRAAPEVLVMGCAWPRAPEGTPVIVHGLLQQLQEAERRRHVGLQLRLVTLAPALGIDQTLRGPFSRFCALAPVMTVTGAEW